MLINISKKTGLTRTEIKIALFIVTIFILGFSYNYFIRISGKAHYKIIDYSEYDSLFYGSGIQPSENSYLKSDNKEVDYKQEVLNFNTYNFNNVPKKSIPAGKSVNLNTAGIKDLMLLPGIGEKTAQNIINYRKTINRFANVNELLNVKGIGESKFAKIKKYIFID